MFAAGFLALYGGCGAACRCCIPPLSAVKLMIYKREGPVSCNQPISISVMAAWQHPAVPDVPPRADGVLVSSAVLLQCSLRRERIHMCALAHTVTHDDTYAPTHKIDVKLCMWEIQIIHSDISARCKNALSDTGQPTTLSLVTSSMRNASSVWYRSVQHMMIVHIQ